MYVCVWTGRSATNMGVHENSKREKRKESIKQIAKEIIDDRNNDIKEVGTTR